MAKYIAMGVTALFAGAEALELTPDNFDAEVKGDKNAFVKFQAPWCGHCKRMKPAWDQLAAEYDGHASIVVGDIDCTVHQSVCSDNGVRGYPTIKYWKAGAESPYQGGRDYDALKKFVESTL